MGRKLPLWSQVAIGLFVGQMALKLSALIGVFLVN